MSPTLSLLTPAKSNPKTAKGDLARFEAAVLHLAPGNISGHEVCGDRSDGCTYGCLNSSGHGGIGDNGIDLPDNSVQRARIRKTQWFFTDRPGFMRQLVREIETLQRRAVRNDREPVLRLNATSDIGWAHVRCVRDGLPFPNLMTAFPAVTFYDYTKVPSRITAQLPANYVLTFSLSENNDVHAAHALRNGVNVAAVLQLADSELMPERWGGYDVLDGTTHDFRFLDARGCVPGYIVGLRPKGRAKHDTSGFVRPLDGSLDLTRTPIRAASRAA